MNLILLGSILLISAFTWAYLDCKKYMKAHALPYPKTNNGSGSLVIKDHKKILDQIASSKTIEQLQTVRNMIDSFEKKHKDYFWIKDTVKGLNEALEKSAKTMYQVWN